MANELSAAELRTAAIVCEHLDEISTELRKHEAHVQDNSVRVSSDLVNGLNGQFYYSAEADCWVYAPGDDTQAHDK